MKLFLYSVLTAFLVGPIGTPSYANDEIDFCDDDDLEDLCDSYDEDEDGDWLSYMSHKLQSLRGREVKGECVRYVHQPVTPIVIVEERVPVKVPSNEPVDSYTDRSHQQQYIGKGETVDMKFYGCFEERRYCVDEANHKGFSGIYAGIDPVKCTRNRPWACYVTRAELLP